MTVSQGREQISGLALALACGIILGSAVAVSRFAYDGGANGITVALFRVFFIVLVLTAGMKVAGRSFKIPSKLLPMVIVNGILWGLMSYGNVGAVEYISIGLSSLLFFTFPIIIAVLVMVLRIEFVSRLKVLATLLAFAGLAIMLGVSLGNVDGRGTALSLVGAVATAVNAILVARYFKHVDVFAISLYFNAVALLFLMLVVIFVMEMRMPTNAVGWSGMIGVAVLQAIGAPLYLFAIAKVGALKTGMATNIQPVTAIFEAWVLFDEVLGALQALGGALVLFAIGLMQWVDLRKHRPGD